LVKAVVFERNGGPEVLDFKEAPDPEPADGRVLVDVEAVGVNFRDVYEREMEGYGPGEPPFVSGIEGAGRVAAVGAGVDEFRIGDRVVWKVFGSYAEQVLVPLREAVPIPEGVDDETACALVRCVDDLGAVAGAPSGW